MYFLPFIEQPSWCLISQNRFWRGGPTSRGFLGVRFCQQKVENMFKGSIHFLRLCGPWQKGSVCTSPQIDGKGQSFKEGGRNKASKKCPYCSPKKKSNEDNRDHGLDGGGQYRHWRGRHFPAWGGHLKNSNLTWPEGLKCHSYFLIDLSCSPRCIHQHHNISKLDSGGRPWVWVGWVERLGALLRQAGRSHGRRGACRPFWQPSLSLLVRDTHL